MVMEELSQLMGLKSASGAVIVNEKTGLPYHDWQFRNDWREIADACGIPRNVKNMDSRAGGITEATDADIPLEHIRHAATHSNIETTQRYSRGFIEKVNRVMRERSAYRNKKGTN
jgi:hypothetical protein